MTGHRRLALILAVSAGLLLSACGGGGENNQSGKAGKLSTTVVAHANAACRDFLREIRQIAEGALASPPNNVLELTTERLVKPSIPVLERVAARQQALEPAARDPRFDVYAELFDPIIVLAQQRLTAGREADYTSSRGLENMLTDLGLEQRAIARGLGLTDCDVDYQHVLLSSLTE